VTLAEAAAEADALAQAGDERALATLRAQWDEEIEAAARDADYRTRFRPLLHELAARDPNGAVRRLAVVCLRNGTPQPATIQLLDGIADSDEEDAELRKTARSVSALLLKKSRAK
jgi:hypothetical protein